ncbi:MAG TPA: bifunctional UDP-N-acetylmuramoyl-tripeptide:D-alanyl-D-alanine ligase/alanine racemase [Puia sp.]|nr:bifunctional UDP-N-acetylmuramoyl-tripeptide:D-alanyl-D-alanine ligase/alanine racemase [Puia sp.]
MKYAIEHIKEIVQGTWLQFRRNDPVEHLLLDSRRLIFPDTSLFFSLKGPRRDGSHFIEELYRRGVRNFVVEEGPASRAIAESSPAPHTIAEANIILVKDSLAALQQLAAYHRRQFSLPVIGITGSNGKTIVKEWLNQLLEDKYHIVRSPKSYNSQIGVPLSVWQLNESHELAIFEAGISRHGEMQRLAAIIHPTIGLFTNIGEAHSEGFTSLADKAAEKLQLFSQSELLIYNKDQPGTERAIRAWLATRETTAPRLFSWGRAEDATLVILESTGYATGSTSPLGDKGVTSITARYEGREFSFTVPFTDEASLENILACTCVLLHFRQPVDAIRSKLQRLSPIAMRLELKNGINHCSIINDSYSADLSSLSIALDFLSQQQQHARRTVILSDFLESGLEQSALYAEIARALRQKQVDRLVGVGSRISAHAQVIGQWFPGETAFYPSVDHFKKDLHHLHFRDETILIKGARVFEFEEIDRWLSEQIHQTVLEINLNAMAHNLRQYRQLLQPATKMMAMVKAFAYGSGSYEIANLLEFHGVDYLGVAYADEGVVLRKAGIHMPIMVMNTEDSSFDSLVKYNLEPVIYSFSLLRSFDKWLKKEGILQFPVHIELETGMNRLGFPLEEVGELGPALFQAAFKVQSVFSHLAASEEAQQDPFSRQQGSSYLAAAQKLQEFLPYPFLRHIANSAAIIRHPQLQLDMVRLGIGLYGIDSADSHQLDLLEVSTLKSTIAQIKPLHEGDTVGYNRRGIAGPHTLIATVRIGYADGYPRSLGYGNGKMWVKGRLAPVIGSVCMDMTMIDITGIPDVEEGDEVVVFGNELSVNQLAHWAQTIPYEILTGVSQRVKRVYFEE